MAKKISELPEVTDVQDADEYELARSGSSYKITGESLTDAFGGGGSLPAWWTVDSTPGAESVNFGGAVEVEMAYDAPALVLRTNLDPGTQTTLPFQFYDEDGDLAVDIDSQGILDTRQVVVQSPPNTGADGGGVILNSRGQVAITPRDSSQPAFRVDNTSFQNVVLIQPDGFGDLLEISPRDDGDTAMLIVSHAAPTVDVFQLWDNAFNNVMFAIGKFGHVDMLEQSEPAAPAANTGRLFVKDTGGKSQLLIRFPSGASQVIATEP